MSEVFVNKTTLLNLMGPAAMNFAIFASGDSTEGKAVKLLFENIDQLDLTCDMVQLQLIPLLSAVGVFTQSDVDRIQSYINNVLS